MKKIFACICVLSTISLAGAQATKTKQAAPSTNAVSQGNATMSGVGDAPVGPNEAEKKEARARASSMGGAPNAGGGMGTGTGAGSRVGNPTGKGSINAGSHGNIDEERR